MTDLVDVLRANVKQARRQARDILADPKTVVLDTETTGLVDGSYICDLAIIARGKTLVNTLVNPQVHIPEEASRIHGIYDKDVADAPTFEKLWPEVEPLLRRSRVVIYNVQYDMRIIGNEVTRMGEPTFRVTTDDALEIYQRWYFGGIGRSSKGQTKLTTPHCDAPACQLAVAVHSGNAHRAYYDCLATVERLKMIANTCWLNAHYKRSGRK